MDCEDEVTSIRLKMAEIRATVSVMETRLDQHESDIARVNEAGSKRYSEIMASSIHFRDECKEEHARIISTVATSRKECKDEARRDVEVLAKDIGRQFLALSTSVTSLDKTLTEMRSKAIWWLLGIVATIVVPGILAVIISRGG